MHARARHLLLIALLGLVYFFAAKASLAVAIPPGYATAIWPPSGIALAALLLWGTPLWPGVWIASFAANLTVGGSVLFLAADGTRVVFNTAEPLTADDTDHQRDSYMWTPAGVQKVTPSPARGS